MVLSILFEVEEKMSQTSFTIDKLAITLIEMVEVKLLAMVEDTLLKLYCFL